ncbi:PAS domain-containing protein [Thermocatellispora tengchongensis]|uniref:PAS domain-containing protein n=1 Tax=Thermocatellispora tengchongensis TaxID=1073253 RepID=UPI003643F2B9
MGAADEFRQNAAVARAFGQNRIAVVMRGRDLRVVQSHLSSEMLGGLTIPVGSELDELMTPEDAREVERRLREVLDTGRPFTDWRRSVRPRRFPEQEWDVSVSAFPLDGADGRPAGVAVVFIDLTEQRRARQRLDLLYRAAADIGASLDVTRTTQGPRGRPRPGVRRPRGREPGGSGARRRRAAAGRQGGHAALPAGQRQQGVARPHAPAGRRPPGDTASARD